MTATATIKPEKKFFTNIDILIMLQDSEIADKLDLKSSEYAVLSALARCYNHKKGGMYPSIEKIRKRVGGSESTVKRTLKELRLKGLIMVEKNKQKNNYKFTERFFRLIQNDPVESVKMTSEHNNNHEQNKGTSSCGGRISNPVQNDDDFKNNFSFPTPANSKNEKTDQSLDQETFGKLKNWGFVGIKPALLKYGVDAIKDCIDEVERRNPGNKGAYLRTLLASYTGKNHFKIQRQIKKIPAYSPPVPLPKVTEPTLEINKPMQDMKKYLDSLKYKNCRTAWKDIDTI